MEMNVAAMLSFLGSGLSAAPCASCKGEKQQLFASFPACGKTDNGKIVTHL